jgi:hypothetical protein
MSEAHSNPSQVRPDVIVVDEAPLNIPTPMMNMKNQSARATELSSSASAADVAVTTGGMSNLSNDAIHIGGSEGGHNSPPAQVTEMSNAIRPATTTIEIVVPTASQAIPSSQGDEAHAESQCHKERIRAHKRAAKRQAEQFEKVSNYYFFTRLKVHPGFESLNVNEFMPSLKSNFEMIKI